MWILPGKSSKIETVSSLYASNSMIAWDSSTRRSDQARDIFQIPFFMKDADDPVQIV